MQGGVPCRYLTIDNVAMLIVVLVRRYCTKGHVPFNIAK